MSEEKPQHLHLITSSLRWDWRKENPVELVLLVFIFVVFLAMPRAGCGVSYKASPAAQAPAAAAKVTAQGVNVAPAQPAAEN